MPPLPSRFRVPCISGSHRTTHRVKHGLCEGLVFGIRRKTLVAQKRTNRNFTCTSFKKNNHPSKKIHFDLERSLVHISNFLGDFVFLTDANERTRTEKYRVAFQNYFACHSFIHSITDEKSTGSHIFLFV